MPELMNGYGWMIIGGLKLTIIVSISSMTVAIVLGLITSILSLSGSTFARYAIATYTTVIRGIPELVLLLLVYYGAPTLIQDLLATSGIDAQINLNPFVAGVATLGFIYGAFSCEVFRAAYLAVPRGQFDSATAMGLTGRQTLAYVIIPQMMRYALPGLGNVWMVLLKATALISIIQLPELMRRTDMAARATREPFTFFLIACLIYVVLTVISMHLQQRAESWANRGVLRGGA